MYIAPNSTIRILTGVNINNSYNDTLYFDTLLEQTTAFIAKTKYTLNNYTFIRGQRLSIKVELPIGNLYDCSYLMFQNTSFSNKWFYAFIIDVEYVNNSVTQIFFEIDEIQTWLFDMNLGECIVERNHIRLDAIGASLTPENVPTGEQIYSEYDTLVKADTSIGLPSLNNYCVAIQVCDAQDATTVGTVYDGVYSGAKLWVCKLTTQGIQNIQTFLGNYIQKMDAIICMYLLPTWCFPTATETGGYATYGSSGNMYSLVLDAIDDNTMLDGYKPVNKKVLQYPYNYLLIDNANGGTLTLRYEFFKNFIPRLVVAGNVSTPVQIICRPTNYKGIDLPAGGSPFYPHDTTQQLCLADFPLCSWNSNAFSEWASKEIIPMTLKTLGTMMTGNPVAIGNQMLNTISETYRHSIEADNFHGNNRSGSINVAMGTMQFYKRRVHVTAEYAKIIDDYFTKYGYAIEKLEVPQRANRVYWTYLKTKGCVITGNCPAESIRRVQSLYDRGICWWTSNSMVGNYNLAEQNTDRPIR